jgi:hypothetical protein
VSKTRRILKEEAKETKEKKYKETKAGKMIKS